MQWSRWQKPSYSCADELAAEMGFQNWQNVQEKLQELEEWLSFERRKNSRTSRTSPHVCDFCCWLHYVALIVSHQVVGTKLTSLGGVAQL